MITLELTPQEVQILMQALGEVPLRIAGPLFTKLQNALMPQQPVDHSDKVL